MPSTALISPNNLSRNVSVHLEEAKNRLSALAAVYLVTEVAGQSPATLDAKRRDLQRFLTFYQGLYGHDRPDEWFVSVTKAFLQHLQKAKLAQAMLGRIYATVRHFARWVHRKFPALFPLGCPTDGVKPPAEPTAHCAGVFFSAGAAGAGYPVDASSHTLASCRSGVSQPSVNQL